MTNQPLVSIIIPTFNRADLIGETLNSIIAQTYKNWECIIVDDGSIENNIEIVKYYQNLDLRFKLYKRCDFNKNKGANSCRNIGLMKAIGDYVVFFDSDDLMLNFHLEEKVKNIEILKSDIVIFKSQYFNNPDNINPINYRKLFSLSINYENYITQKINWITYDPIIKKSLAIKVRFNESLQANQEYNYFSKLLLNVKYAKAIDLILTNRRFDQRSIQGQLSINNNYIDKAYLSFYETYLELSDKISKTSRLFLVNKMLELVFKKSKLIDNNRIKFYKILIKEFGLIKGLNKIRIIELRNFKK